MSRTVFRHLDLRAVSNLVTLTSPGGLVTKFCQGPRSNIVLGAFYVLDVDPIRAQVDASLHGFLAKYFPGEATADRIRSRLGSGGPGALHQKGYQRATSLYGIKMSLLTVLEFSGLTLPFNQIQLTTDGSLLWEISLRDEAAARAKQYGAAPTTKLASFADDGNVSVGLVLFERNPGSGPIASIGLDVTDLRRFPARPKRYADPLTGAARHASVEAFRKAIHPGLFQSGERVSALRIGTLLRRISGEMAATPLVDQPSVVAVRPNTLSARALEEMNAGHPKISWSVDAASNTVFSFVTLPRAH